MISVGRGFDSPQLHQAVVTEEAPRSLGNIGIEGLFRIWVRVAISPSAHNLPHLNEVGGRSDPKPGDVGGQSAFVHAGGDMGQIVVEEVRIGVERHRHGLVPEHAVYGLHVRTEGIASLAALWRRPCGASRSTCAEASALLNQDVVPMRVFARRR